MLSPFPNRGGGRGSLPLARFFDDVYAPLMLRGRSPAYAEIHRGAVRWLAKVLRAPPQLADLNRLTLEMALEQLAKTGLQRTRLKELRKCWLRLARYAEQLGWLPRIDAPPLPRPVPIARPWTEPAPPAGSLLAFYRQSYRPELAPQLCSKDLSRYDSAINHFHDFVGRPIALDEVTPALLDEFRTWLDGRPLTPVQRAGYRGALRRIMRAHDAEAFPKTDGGPGRTIVGPDERERAALPPAKRQRRQGMPIPVGAPGTLLQFYTDCYIPQRIPFACDGHKRGLYGHFRQLRRCFGRDLRLEELDRQKFAELIAWLDESGVGQRTIKNVVTRLLAVWRYAEELELAPAVPRFRRWRLDREEPDAWSLDELARLVNATARLDRPPIGGIPAPKFWRALLLVGYYTALRRSTLRRLRTIDLRLDGWLDVPAAAMKNGNGQRFKLGADAMEALAAIAAPDRELLFPSGRDATWLSKHFRALLKLAGIPKSRRPNGHLHKLRRTAITHTAARAGMAAAVALAGHSSDYCLKFYIDKRFLPNNDATAWLPSLGELCRRQDLAGDNGKGVPQS